MPTPNLNIGLTSLCLLQLAACSFEPPVTPAPIVVMHAAPSVAPCERPSPAIKTNGDLLKAYLASQSALRQCAAKVDAIIRDAQKAEQPSAKEPTDAKTH
ncbi:Rz1-like lysis system protein LysC [Celerinatantimonas sp. YJH-8]|uniref:Rz1-like lysis system protein LysC n=1 Tax=Celerinatantimonas sp. YJH-8 TaxID=3228714 RepID=UPI0038C7EE9B